MAGPVRRSRRPDVIEPSRAADLIFVNRKQHSKETDSVPDLTSLSAAELADRIAIVREDIRQISEQATAQSGAADEERNADRLAVSNEELDNLLAEQARRSGR